MVSSESVSKVTSVTAASVGTPRAVPTGDDEAEAGVDLVGPAAQAAQHPAGVLGVGGLVQESPSRMTVVSAPMTSASPSVRAATSGLAGGQARDVVGGVRPSGGTVSSSKRLAAPRRADPSRPSSSRRRGERGGEDQAEDDSLMSLVASGAWRAFFWPTFGSVPALIRAMLDRCLTRTNKVARRANRT